MATAESKPTELTSKFQQNGVKHDIVPTGSKLLQGRALASPKEAQRVRRQRSSRMTTNSRVFENLLEINSTQWILTTNRLYFLHHALWFWWSALLLSAFRQLSSYVVSSMYLSSCLQASKGLRAFLNSQVNSGAKTCVNHTRSGMKLVEEALEKKSRVDARRVHVILTLEWLATGFAVCHDCH